MEAAREKKKSVIWDQQGMHTPSLLPSFPSVLFSSLPFLSPPSRYPVSPSFETIDQ